MKRILSFIAIQTICFGVQARNDFYATLGAGLVVPMKNSSVLDNSNYVVYGPTSAPSGESIFNLPNVNWINKFRCGFNVNAALGYHLFGNWRSDIEFVYQRFRRKVVGSYDFAEYDALDLSVIDSVKGISMTESSGYANVYSVLTNGYYDFHSQSKFSPLLGAGFGIAWMDAVATTASGAFTTNLGSRATTLQHSPKLTGTALALQLKAGMNYNWTRSTNVILQYRLFLTSNFITNISSIITNPGSGSSTRYFYVSKQTLSGILTNSFEVIFKFNW